MRNLPHRIVAVQECDARMFNRYSTVCPKKTGNEIYIDTKLLERNLLLFSPLGD
jgi:hypothetical protein